MGGGLYLLVCAHFLPPRPWKGTSDIKMLHPKILQCAFPKNKSCFRQNFQTVKVALMSSVFPKDPGSLLLSKETGFLRGVLASVSPRCQAVASGCSQGPCTGPAVYVLLGLVLILIQKPDTQGLGFPGTNNPPILLLIF